MPYYSYTCSACGLTSEEFSCMSERKASIDCPECETQAPRDLVADHCSFKRPKPYQVDSWALAVQPDEIKKTKQEDKAMGSTAAEYLPNGQLRFTSMKQQNDYCRVRGYTNKDNYY